MESETDTTPCILRVLPIFLPFSCPSPPDPVPTNELHIVIVCPMYWSEGLTLLPFTLPHCIDFWSRIGSIQTTALSLAGFTFLAALVMCRSLCCCFFVSEAISRPYILVWGCIENCFYETFMYVSILQFSGNICVFASAMYS